MKNTSDILRFSFLSFIFSIFFGLMPLSWGGNNDNYKRIVVIPKYQSTSADKNPFQNTHLRKLMLIVSEGLISNDFTVISPLASADVESEFHRLLNLTSKEGPYAARDYASCYGTQAVMLIDLGVDVYPRMDNSGYESLINSEVEIYDSKGSFLMGFANSTRAVDSSRSRAISDGVTSLAYDISKHVNRRSHALEKSLIERLLRANKQVEIRLYGANNATIDSLLGRLLNTVEGVDNVVRLSTRFYDDQKDASFMRWMVTLTETDAFRLQENFLSLIDDVLESSGRYLIHQSDFRFSKDELNTLRGIRLQAASPAWLNFVYDPSLEIERVLNADITN